MVCKVQSKSTNPGVSSRFHHGWCNSRCCVNETLQNEQIVLVSDPFTKDSEDPAVRVLVYEVNAKFGRSSPSASQQ